MNMLRLLIELCESVQRTSASGHTDKDRNINSMNLLSLIIIAFAFLVVGCVFYAAWKLSSGRFEPESQLANQQMTEKKEPDESKES